MVVCGDDEDGTWWGAGGRQVSGEVVVFGDDGVGWADDGALGGYGVEV